MQSLRVHLLGTVRIENQSGAPIGHLTRVLQGLLAFLALHRNRTHTRETLYARFWGDQPEARARRCLNTAIWRLRQVLEPPGTARGTFIIGTADGDIRINWGPHIWLDADQLERAAARLTAAVGSIDELTEIETSLTAGGELLEGFYDDWALEARERFRLSTIRGLSDLAIAFRNAGAPRRALAAAERVLSLDPLHETAVREVLRASVATGDRGYGVRCYAALVRRLRSELGVAPMPETTALAREVRSASEDAPVGELPHHDTATPTGRATVLRQALLDVSRVRRRLFDLLAAEEDRTP